MSVRPVTRATAALIEYLADPSHGIAVALGSIRTDESLTTALLPDPGEIVDWRQRRERGQSFPSVEILPMQGGADEEANQRIYPIRLSVTATIPSNVVQGSQEDLIAAGWLYLDALYQTLQRRTPRGEQGNTLANGGAGAGLGRIIRCTIDSTRLLIDDEQIQRVYAAAELTVTVAEDY